MPAPSQLLILGSSTRAAAQSAARGGISPICADMFADEDLLEIATVLAVPSYPGDLLAASQNAADIPWMYTGALENQAALIDAIGRQRRLFGNSGLALHRARDPVFIHATLIAAHLPALTIYCAQTEPTHGEWLEKSFGSAGGSGVRVWDRTAAAQQLLATVQNGPADAYLQQRATGTSASAVFLASAGETFLIGISKQLVGLPEVHAAPFAYCGSIGPWSVSDEIRQQIEAVGTTVANACGLRGLFGCDFMIDLRTAWLTEVNPRYPASAEIFDHAWGVSLVDWHCLACMGIADKQSDVFRIPADHPNGIIGKLVIYAEQDIVAPQLERGFYQTDGWEFPTLADIPRAGTQILKGHPVCTVLAAGDSLEDCQRQLFKRVKTLQSRLACK